MPGPPTGEPSPPRECHGGLRRQTRLQQRRAVTTCTARPNSASTARSSWRSMPATGIGRCWLLGARRASPTAVLHQEMVLARAQRQQATADRVARHDH
jgi:hypothetical protein